MSIKQAGGVFGRNPTFNDVTIDGTLTFDGDIDINSDLKIDGDLEVTGTSKLTGNVGIGQAVGSDALEVTGTSSFDAVNATRTAATSAYSGYIADATNTLGADAGNGLYVQTRWNTATNVVAKFATNSGSSDVLTLNGDRNMTLHAGNLIIGTSGKGIDFSATAGTGTSELLDDYEEGTWTPVLSDASSGGNLGSATINKANYTKVGRSVTLSASLSDIVTTGMGSSLSLYIQGLTFTSASSNSSFGVVKIDSVALQGGRTSAVCEVSDSDAWLRFWAIGDAIADTPIDCGDITSGSSDIFFTISYHV